MSLRKDANINRRCGTKFFRLKKFLLSLKIVYCKKAILLLLVFVSYWGKEWAWLCSILCYKFKYSPRYMLQPVRHNSFGFNNIGPRSRWPEVNYGLVLSRYNVSERKKIEEKKKRMNARVQLLEKTFLLHIIFCNFLLSKIRIKMIAVEVEYYYVIFQRIVMI